MNVLTVHNLSKRYAGFALQDVSFELEPGCITGFIGRNGAGKTTTLKALLNVIHPDGGEACFWGEPFAGNEFAIKQRIGFVSGGFDYYAKKKLATITAVTRRFYTGWDDAAYRRYLGLFALDESKTPEQLSAGMRVKYALALALSHSARLLILDEPTSGLDPVSRDELLDIFLELAAGGAISILFSTHITSDLDKVADNIVYIRDGVIVHSGALRAFLAQYRVAQIGEAQLTAELRPLLVGCKRTRHGYSALVEAGQPLPAGLETAPADLETIMVHLEKTSHLEGEAAA